MNPVVESALSTPLLPVAQGQTKDPKSVAGQSGLAVQPNPDGQPSFAALFKMLFPAMISSAANPAVTSQVVPGDTDSGLQSGDVGQPKNGKAKASKIGADANPNAAVAAVLFPVPLVATPSPAPPAGTTSARQEKDDATLSVSLPRITVANGASHPADADALASPIGPAKKSSGGQPMVAAESVNETVSAAPAEKAIPALPPVNPALTSDAAGGMKGFVLAASNSAPTNPPALTILDTKSDASAGETLRQSASNNDPAIQSTTGPAGAAPTQAAATTSHPPAAKPALADQIQDPIVSHLDQLRQVGRVEVQLDLHPPELGRMQLHLSLEDGHVNVRMVVQDDATKRLIDQQLEPLRVRFSEMGVSVGQFDVRRDGNSPNPDQQPAAEPSAQALQAAKNGPPRLQKTYAAVANPDGAVDLIA